MELTGEDKTKLKQKLLSTFKVFDNLCRKNNIRYFAVGGTAIGAVRHQGFIPWDDDIDVIMPMPDYHRFLRLKGTIPGYRIIDYHDEGYYLPFAKFIDSNTTLWEYPCYEFLIGSFVDVFPLYMTSNNLEETKSTALLCEKIFERYRKSIAKYSITQIFGALFRLKLRLFISYLSTFYYRLNEKKYYKAFGDFMERLSQVEGNRFIPYFDIYPVEKIIIEPEWLSSQVEMPFEDIQIYLPCGYNEYLGQVFGDYMQLPPESERVSWHSHYYLNLEEGLNIDEVRRRIKKDKHRPK